MAVHPPRIMISDIEKRNRHQRKYSEQYITPCAVKEKANIHKCKDYPEHSSALNSSSEEEQAGNNDEHHADSRYLYRRLEFFKVQADKGYGGYKYECDPDQDDLLGIFPEDDISYEGYEHYKFRH